ncbi:MAG TPA: acyl-[acyl-carrier-protein]--UDP-N-acetylglucosamine O-acyltransferase [Opitutae bacterium]|nr:acyl-[acyl-carrier-protein]--UDP-N-acetylglucosamine O-acyltransferase [Opitutae bacterium]
MIHATAIIESGAQVDSSARIGAYAYIGPEVVIGKDTVVDHHATIDGRTTLGASNEVFPYAFIGAKTHDLKHKGGRPRLTIGDGNVFREYVSIHLATNDDEATVVGSSNVFLAYAHVAHDCQVGNHCVMSSHAALGGHVVLGDYVNVGWDAGVHQFCQVGSYAMLGACSKVVQDVPPYMTVDGNPAIVRTINKIGLERRGFSSEDIEQVRAAYKILYREGLNRSQALDRLKRELNQESTVIRELIDFSGRSQRGFA